MKNTWFLVLAISVFPLFAASQEVLWDEVVYLKNGSMIRGLVIEQIFGKSIKLKTSDGSIWVFKYEEVEKIVKEPKATSVPGNTSPSIYPPTTPARPRTKFDDPLRQHDDSSFASSTQANGRTTTFALGIQGGTTLSGLSAIVNISDRIGIQGLVNLFSIGSGNTTFDMTAWGGRMLIYLDHSDRLYPYLFGFVGQWKYTSNLTMPTGVYPDITAATFEETYLTIGVGGGAMYRLPDSPIAINAELGYARLTNSDSDLFGVPLDFNFNSLWFGFGVHIWF